MWKGVISGLDVLFQFLITAVDINEVLILRPVEKNLKERRAPLFLLDMPFPVSIELLIIFFLVVSIEVVIDYVL